MSVSAVPWVVAVGGRGAVGKSSVARALAERLGAGCLQSDRLREDLLYAEVPGGGDGPSKMAFWPGFEPRVYGDLLRRGRAELEAGRSIVLDGCFARTEQREAARSLARQHGAPFLFVECRAEPEVIRARLAAREAEDGSGWHWISDRLAARWEEGDALAPDERLVLDTSHALGDALAALDARVADRVPVRDQPLQAVTFDCWNTLLFEPDWDEAHARRVGALTRAALEAGRTTTIGEADAAFSGAWERHMRLWSEGLATGSREVARDALGTLGLRRPHAELEHLVEAFEEASHTSRVQSLPGAQETLRDLSASGVRCALVCDTGLTPGRVVRRHLERLGLLEFLEVQAFSDEVGVPKPDPRTFRAALDPLGVAPNRALHVGDLRRTDVAGARGLGMQTARLSARHDDTTALPEADLVVESIPDLWRALAGRLPPRRRAEAHR
jgi:putative hydrolase of the HAD superfamily